MIVTNDMKEVCRQIATLYKNQLEADNAVATGTLINSVDNFEIEADDLHFSLFFNLPRYWKFAPENVRSGNKMPPVQAIQDWINAKNLDLNAFAVAKTIAEVGWKNQPRKNLQEVIDSQSVQDLTDELEDMIIEQLEEDLFKEI